MDEKSVVHLSYRRVDANDLLGKHYETLELRVKTFGQQRKPELVPNRLLLHS
jgi:hypothetical protein